MFDFLKKFRSLAKNETAAEAVNVTPPQAAPSDGETSSEAVEEQIALKLEELRAAVEQGAAIAQYDLSLCYEEGWALRKARWKRAVTTIWPRSRAMNWPKRH